MKNILIITAFIFSITVNAQTTNENLKTQLEEMKAYFLSGDFENFSRYTYPKVIEMTGGQSNMVKATRKVMNQFKEDGYTYIDLSYKNYSGILKKEGELQCTLTQQSKLNTPKGKIEVEYTLIAISKDNGDNWTFIDTSGKSKETILKYFPNLNSGIVIRPKTQKMLE